MKNNDEVRPDPVVTRLVQLSANLLPDQKRVRVALLLSDASSRPTVDLRLLDHMQQEIARTTILGVFSERVNFTLHLGKHNAEQQLFLNCAVIHNDKDVLDTRQVIVEGSGA